MDVQLNPTEDASLAYGTTAPDPNLHLLDPKACFLNPSVILTSYYRWLLMNIGGHFQDQRDVGLTVPFLSHTPSSHQ